MPFELFYGSRFGFNYSSSLVLFFKELMVASGALPAAGETESKVMGALKVVGKGTGLQFSSRARAAAFHATISKGDLAFCKSFWNVTESGLAHAFQGSSIMHSVLQHCPVMAEAVVPAQPLPVPADSNALTFTLPFIGEVPCMLCVAQNKIHAPSTN